MLRGAGYEFGYSRINALAYNDDIFLFSLTSKGIELLLEAAERKATQQGLLIYTAKCVALSIVPDDKNKRCKVLTEAWFKLAERQLTLLGEWRYFGLDFGYLGPKTVGGSLENEVTGFREPL